MHWYDTGIQIGKEDIDFIIADINPDGDEFAAIYCKGEGVFSSPTWQDFKNKWVSNRGISFMIKNDSQNLVEISPDNITLNPQFMTQPWAFESLQRVRFIVKGDDNFIAGELLNFLGDSWDVIPWGSTAVKIQKKG